MKRIVTFVTSGLVAFACGITASALLPWNQHSAEKLPFEGQVLTFQFATPAPQAEVTPTPDVEVVFGKGRLKLEPDEVHLISDRLHYEINATYPQVVGSDAPHIRQLNQRIRELVTAHYQWPLAINGEELRQTLQMYPEGTNTVDINYEVSLASDSVLSIYFGAYTSAIGSAHGNVQSFVVNYDLVSRKELKLSDLFAPDANHLRFISRYCKNAFDTAGLGHSLFPEGLAPVRRNFHSWNVTSTGIRFNFDRCQVFGCSAGEQSVEIPYGELKSRLSARGMSILPISSVVKVKTDH
jgi:hypothetical protein